MRKFNFLIFLAFVMSFSATSFAVDEVVIGQPTIRDKSFDRYTVAAPVTNKSAQAREVVLRAQLAFFDKTSPEGDKPVTILRKDATIILKARETRKVQFRLVDEGSVPKERVRLEPEIRLRRQREWNY